MPKREKAIKEIIDQLGYLHSKIKLNNYANYYDINITSEDFFCKLLNLVFDYKLEDLNKTEKNAKAVDLIDKENKVAVQVTVTNKREKIQKTIDKFLEKYSSSEFKRLIILILGDKKKYTSPFISKTFSFDKDKDILCIKDIVEKIIEKDIDKLEEILKFLDNEIFFKKKNSMEEKVIKIFEKVVDDLSQLQYGGLTNACPSIGEEKFEKIKKIKFFISKQIIPQTAYSFEKYREHLLYILNYIITIVDECFDFKDGAFPKYDFIKRYNPKTGFDPEHEKVDYIYNLKAEFLCLLVVDLYATINLLKAILLEEYKYSGTYHQFSSSVLGPLFDNNPIFVYKNRKLIEDHFMKIDIDFLTTNDLKNYRYFLITNLKDIENFPTWYPSLYK